MLVIDAMDAKTAPGNTFGRTVTLEVMPDQAEKINVATELGKLSLALHLSGTDGATPGSALRPGKALHRFDGDYPCLDRFIKGAC